MKARSKRLGSLALCQLHLLDQLSLLQGKLSVELLNLLRDGCPLVLEVCRKLLVSAETSAESRLGRSLLLSKVRKQGLLPGLGHERLEQKLPWKEAFVQELHFLL